MTRVPNLCLMHRVYRLVRPNKFTRNQLIDLWLLFCLGAQCIDGRIERSASGETEFVAGSIRIPLPQSCLPEGSITLGVRPEDWEISPSENGQICGHAERVENLGDHRMVELATEGINIFVKTYTLGISENEGLKISLQPEKAHWFERYTGKRITN